MKKTRQTWSDIASSIGVQTLSGVMEMVYGLGLLMFAAINIFDWPSFGYNVSVIIVLIPFYLLNRMCVKPRIKNNASQFPPNHLENRLVIILSSLAIIAGLIIFWLTIKGTEWNLKQLFFQASLFCGISLMAVSLTNGIGRLMLYGQVIVLLLILFISKEVSTDSMFCLIAGLGVVVYFVGLINFRRFVAKYPLYLAFRSLPFSGSQNPAM